MSGAGGVKRSLTDEPVEFVATEDHSLVEVRGRMGDHPKSARVYRNSVSGHISLSILNSAGNVQASMSLTADAFRVLTTVLPDDEPVATEQGDMRPMWTFEGDELRRLIDDLDEEPSWGPIYRVRFAVDEGYLKWKINEDTWSAGKRADGEARS